MSKRRYKLTARERVVEDFFEWPMIWVTMLVVPIIAIPYFLNLATGTERVFQIASVLIWVLFYIEIFVKFVVSSNYLETAKRNWFLIIILLSPALLVFRFIRLIRFVSLIRLLHLQTAVRYLRESVRALVYSLEYIVLALFIFTLTSSFFIWQIEQQAGGNITSFADALWWSVITITTIGYGDVVPGSDQGRVFGAFVSLVGVVLFTILVARITAFFVKDAQIEVLHQALKEERQSNSKKH